MRLFVRAVALLLCVCWAVPVLASKPKRPSKGHRAAKQTRQKARLARSRVESKIPPMQKQAALELHQWLSPLSRRQGQSAPLLAIEQMLRTWIASRWGLVMDRLAWARWAPIRGALQVWSPMPLYRKLHQQKYDTWVFGQLKKFRILLSVPKNSRIPPKGVGAVAMGVKMERLPRMREQKRRPYRLTLHSFADIPPVRILQLDKVLLAIIEKMTHPNLRVARVNQQKPLFPDLQGKHSRRVANWLTSRFPQTSHLLDRYLHVRSILEPIGDGLFKLDLRAQWNLEVLKKDYPRLAKGLKDRKKNQVYIELAFLDAKRHQWLVWSYDRMQMEHRFQAVIGRGGFMFCSRDWRPLSGPWRPTKMGSTWWTHARFVAKSQRLNVKVSQVLFQWKVRAKPRGASLSIEMTREPQFQIDGGELIRFFARVLIPGGVEKLAKRFLRNLAHGDQGRGLRWEWELSESSQYARVFFRVFLPFVPDRVLSSVLRILPTVMPRSGSGSRQRSKAKAKAKRRRPRSPLWRRLYLSIYRDIQSARKVLAQR